MAVRVAPAHAIREPAPIRLGAAAAVGPDVLEHVAGMVEHHIQDHVDPAGMRLVDQRAQLFLRQPGIAPRGIRVAAEARLDRQEILDPVAVVGGRVVLAILQHRRQPDSAHAQALEVVELAPHAVERAALEQVARSVEGRNARRCGRVVEAVDEQKIDPLIAPVGRRRKGRGHVHAHVAHAQALDLWRSRALEYLQDTAIEHRAGHKRAVYTVGKRSDNAREHQSASTVASR